MYKTKQLLPARGQVKINVWFVRQDGIRGVETGYSQSVNVKRHFKQMLEEAVLNAFYKWNHRTGGKIFSKDNYAEDLSEYIKELKILSYIISYFEDRIYSYKRETVKSRKTGKTSYKYTIRRKGRVHKRVKKTFVNKKSLNKLGDDMY